MSNYSREVSGCEMFFIAYNELRPPFVIQIALEAQGEPSPESLYEALRLTTEANPGSALQFDEDGEDARWIIGPQPTLTVVDAPEFDGNSEVNAPFFMWPMDACKGPVCELLFVRGKTCNYLVFRAVHAVMDGQGTLLWVKDFMRCLRGEAPVGHPSTLSVDEFTRQMKTDARALPQPDALHPCGQPAAESNKGYHWRRLTSDRPLDSATSGRIAVCLSEQARRHGEGTVRLNLPTDLRHYRTDERTTGNFYNSLFIEVGPDSAPQMIGLKIIQKLYKHEGKRRVGIYAGQDIGSLAIHRIKAFRDLAHVHHTGLYAFSATLSHLGTLKSDELSAPTFETTSAFFVPLVGDSGCVITLNGFDDHVEAAVGLSDRFSNDGRLDQLAAALSDAIRA